MSRWLVWMPALMVGALFYWTVALGMGGLSLVAVSALSGDCGGSDNAQAAADPIDGTTGAPGTTDDDQARLLPEASAEEPIVVRLQSDDDEADDTEEAADDVDEDNNRGGAAPVEATAVEPVSGTMSGI